MVLQIRKHMGFIVLAGAVLLALAFPAFEYLSARPLQEAQDSPYLRNDPEKIVLSASDDRVPCGECHTLEYDAWKSSQHAMGFDEMHRSSQAQSILERMEFKLAKRESLCLTCHYTATIQRDQARAIAGVSCESCHGAARDWVNVHNDYGATDRDSESAAHKTERIQQSIEGGMLKPSDDVYAVAANCFECHTVPSEELINVGRHPSGSSIELVEWSDKIRHNFLAAQWSGDETNQERTPARNRLLYVVGRLLDYEYSVRGAARATEEKSYAKAMERRAISAVRELERVASLVQIDEVNAVLKLHQGISLKPGNGVALGRLAEQVRSQGQRLGKAIERAEGWGALDALIDGTAAALPPAAESPVAATAASESSEGLSVAAPESGAPATPPTPTASGANVPTVAGQRRAKPAWFANEAFEYTVPGCNCHASAEDWLFGDPHSSSADPISRGSQKALEIATLYGLSPAQMRQGNQICMNCHGTIESGAGPGQVFESVGCESCHGPSSGYLRPHKRGEGFENGLKNLNDASIRAANCARCHHITDERLLASGHSSGEGYNIASANNAIKHWPDPDLDRPAPAQPPNDAIQSAFNQIKSQRPVPSVQIAQLPAAAAPQPESRRASAIPRATSTGTATVSTAPRPPRNRPVARGAVVSSGGPIN